MKTSYSRRELYAFGEPIGESSTYELAGRRIYGGGGGGLGDIVDSIGDLGQGAIDTVGDVGKSIDQTVRDVVPGGWTTAALLAGGYAYDPTMGGFLGPAGEVVPASQVAPSALDALGGDMVTGSMSGVTPTAAAGYAAADGVGASGLGSGSGIANAADLGGEYLGGLGAGATGAGITSAADLGGEYLGGLGGAGAGITGLGDASAWDAATSGEYGGPAASSGTLGSWLSKSLTGNPGGLSLGGGLLGAAGLAGLMSYLKADNDRFGTPGRQDNVGSMGQFKYDPSKFAATTPDPAMFRAQGAPTAKIGYAAGGNVQLQGHVTLDDPSGQQGGQFGGQGANGYQPAGSGGFDPRAIAANPQGFQQFMQGARQQEMQHPGSTMLSQLGGSNVSAMGFAAGGGISSLGGYSDGGRMLKGPGDGMSDSIPATIGHKRPARLADGEFVVPADVVSHLGNGSTDAGAKRLYAMMDKVRQARTGNKKQGKEIKADKYMPK